MPTLNDLRGVRPIDQPEVLTFTAPARIAEIDKQIYVVLADAHEWFEFRSGVDHNFVSMVAS